MADTSVAPSNSPLVSVIVVSYNTRAMTLDCLRALYADLEGISSEVWVVDNASKDNSVAAIRQSFPAVRLIENPRNAGFGAANNLALEKAGGKYLLLLNSDAFPLAGAIAALVKYLEEHPDVGVVGPQLLNGDGSLQKSCWKFPTPARALFEALGLSAALPNHPVFGDYFRWAHDEERRVDFVIGAALLLRREVYEEVGGFDENFFLYAEETDWMKRMSEANWPVAFIPWAQVTHLGGASSEAKAGQNPRFFEGQDRFVQKHFGARGLMLFRAATVLGALLRLAMFAAKGSISGRAKGGVKRAQTRSRMQQAWWLARRQATHRWP